jgi:hypothetical protein
MSLGVVYDLKDRRCLVTIDDQRSWLTGLAPMLAPICFPSQRVLAAYKKLESKGLTTLEHWPGEPRPGWVITAAGREWLENVY